MPPQSFIDSAGYRTAYHDVGEGTPVVLLHGSGIGTTGWGTWHSLIPQLAEKLRVIVPDLVGFGGTRPPPENAYSIAQWTDQIVALLDGLEFPSAAIVGHSMGGRIAQRLAVLHPERVARLVLNGSAGPRPFDSPVLRGGGARDKPPPDKARVRAGLERSVYDRNNITDEMVEAQFMASSAPGIHEQAEAMFSNGSVVRDEVVSFESLAKVPHPTLIIHGREDGIVPVDHAWDLLRTIANSELHVAPRCGHWTHIEAPELFRRLVDRHLGHA